MISEISDPVSDPDRPSDRPGPRPTQPFVPGGAETRAENGATALCGDTWRYVAIRGDVTRCVSLTCLSGLCPRPLEDRVEGRYVCGELSPTQSHIVIMEVAPWRLSTWSPPPSCKMDWMD